MTKAPKLLAVTAGGHATMPPGITRLSIPEQEAYLQKTVEKIFSTIRNLVAETYKLRIFSHGSGPQSGIILDRSDRTSVGEDPLHTVPAHYASMDLIGTLGMTIQLIIDNIRRHEELSFPEILGPDSKKIVVAPTSFIIDPNTLQPTKPIGSKLSIAQIADKRALGYTVDNVDGKGNRVLVPSPHPTETYDQDLDSIANSILNDIAVIAAGTGGRALKQLDSGLLEAIESIIDKDRALLQLLIDLALKKGIKFHTAAFITDAPFIVRDYKPIERVIKAAGGLQHIDQEMLRAAIELAGPIRRTTVQEMREHLEKGIESGAISGGAIAKLDSAIKAIEEGGAERTIICNTDTFEDSFTEDQNTGGTTIEMGARWI